MKKRRDFTDFKIGKLTGVRYYLGKNANHMWVMRCDCGMETDRTPKQLFDYINKKLNPMCDRCKLATRKNPLKSKFYGV